MRVVIQRVRHASVTIDGVQKSAIGQGLLVLVGIEEADGTDDSAWLVKKAVGLRIFDDADGVMNLSVRRRSPCGQPVHPHGLDQERQPPLLYSRRTP